MVVSAGMLPICGVLYHNSGVWTNFSNFYCFFHCLPLISTITSGFFQLWLWSTLWLLWIMRANTRQGRKVDVFAWQCSMFNVHLSGLYQHLDWVVTCCYLLLVVDDCRWLLMLDDWGRFIAMLLGHWLEIHLDLIIELADNMLGNMLFLWYHCLWLLPEKSLLSSFEKRNSRWNLGIHCPHA